MMLRASAIVLISFGLLVLPRATQAVQIGQIDNFQDSTTQNWANGGGPNAPPVLNLDGGPSGAGDRYLQISAIGGGGPGGRLTVFNRNQWLGDFISQGVTAVEVDLNNFSNLTLSIRLAFKQEIGSKSPGYLSQAFVLAPNSGWQHAVFAITPATMIALGDPVTFNNFFSGNFEEMRFINSFTGNDPNGDPVAATLGIDNIHAIPEPGTFLLAATGLLIITMMRRWKPARNPNERAARFPAASSPGEHFRS